MNARWRWAVLAGWLLFLAAMSWVVVRTPVVTDVTSFLPGAANPDERLMAEQLRDGISTRLLIVGLRLPRPDNGNADAKPEAAQRAALIAASRALRERLAAEPLVVWANNGDFDALVLEREKLFAARYHLSAGVDTNRFSEGGLKESFAALERALVSASAGFVKPIATQDPTLESLSWLERASARLGSLADDEVWFSKDGRAVLLTLQTGARGYEVPKLRQTLAAVRGHANAALESWPSGLGKPVVELAGPAFFVVASHDAIGADAKRLSLVAISIVAALLWWALRSPQLLGLAAIPVATGALAGFAAVGLTHQSIHGITVAFGVTLIGEAVDYSIYSFVQRRADGSHPDRFWRQIGLAMLTSLIGFLAMFASGFQGLQQLGVFSIVGLIVAAACTRWLLPFWMPAHNRGLRQQGFTWLPVLEHAARRWRWPFAALSVAALAVLLINGPKVWDDNLDSMSAGSSEDIATDARYRTDLGLPDLRLLLTTRGATLEEALVRAEKAGVVLEQLMANGVITGYDSPALLMPSAAKQRARIAALPDAAVLRTRVARALTDGSFQPAAFEPFVTAVSAARVMPLIDEAYYAKTLVGHLLASQVVRSADGVAVLIPIRGARNAIALERDINAFRLEGVALVDLKGDVERFVARYRQQAMNTALLGGVGILLVLAWQLRERRALAAMSATLISTVIMTAAALYLVEGFLTVFNLVSLLLVAGVASNYTLFFSGLYDEPEERLRASVSVFLAAASTFVAFLMLATSNSPVLRMIGLTVSMGAAIGLVASLVFAPRPRSDLDKLTPP